MTKCKNCEWEHRRTRTQYPCKVCSRNSDDPRDAYVKRKEHDFRGNKLEEVV